jgi:prophage maintenance system killer protein
LRLPDLALVVALNHAVRAPDEWFDEPDDLDRVQRILDGISTTGDPVVAAGLIAYRLARAQAFAEGNKRTALLAAKWILERNGVDGARLIPPDDLGLADLLVQAASGHDVETAIVQLLQQRR